MKISFSTLACPDWSWSDIYSMAKDFKFDGIELRGLGNEIFSVKAQPFTDSQLPATIAKLKSLSLEIPCLDSGACLKFKDKYAEAEAEITAYAQLANKIGASYIRILADLGPKPVDEVDDDYIVETLKKLVPVAEEYNVTLLVEKTACTAILQDLLLYLKKSEAARSLLSGICIILTVSAESHRSRQLLTSVST